MFPATGLPTRQGHVAAALFRLGRTAWIREPFLAFHVSGGTTDALLVRPDKEDILAVRRWGVPGI